MSAFRRGRQSCDVCACVAHCITFLKSAGASRDECLDLSSEKIQRVNILCHEVRNLLRANNFRMSAGLAGWVQKISGYDQ